MLNVERKMKKITDFFPSGRHLENWLARKSFLSNINVLQVQPNLGLKNQQVIMKVLMKVSRNNIVIKRRQIK